MALRGHGARSSRQMGVDAAETVPDRFDTNARAAARSRAPSRAGPAGVKSVRRPGTRKVCCRMLARMCQRHRGPETARCGSQKLRVVHEGGPRACCEDHPTCKRREGTVHLSASSRQIPLCVHLQSETVLARITQHARKSEASRRA
jgi:hypothetical protein